MRPLKGWQSILTEPPWVTHGPSDLRVRQYAMSDPSITQVETTGGRVVYRKTRDQMPDIDLSTFHNQKEA